MKLIAAIIIISVMLFPCWSAADIIYFKDGMRTICQGRAWEDKDEVKCDYDGVLLTYRREDVEHIHQTILPQEADEAQPSGSQAASVAPVPPSDLKQSSSPVSDGPTFYDPRRPFKYWTSKSAKHHTYRDAINALAREFGRPSRWIEERIGETNNLERIRKSMSQPDDSTQIIAVPSPGDQPVSGILFYNPRREYKYQINTTQKFHTFEEAIAALALEYKSTPQWVEANMGQFNDMAAIRESLSRVKAGTGGDHK